MRLIDADALKESIVVDDEQGTIANYCRKVFLQCIESVPTVDAILAEKYKAERETLRMRCVPGAEQAFDRRMYGCLKIVPVNYKANAEQDS